jgi:hypothetical protein
MPHLQTPVRQHNLTKHYYLAVRNYVARRRPEILAEARARHQDLQGIVPQVHAPGEEAQVDFCEAFAVIAGKPMKCYLFTLRLSRPRDPRPARRLPDRHRDIHTTRDPALAATIMLADPGEAADLLHTLADGAGHSA